MENNTTKSKKNQRHLNYQGFEINSCDENVYLTVRGSTKTGQVASVTIAIPWHDMAVMVKKCRAEWRRAKDIREFNINVINKMIQGE